MLKKERHFKTFCHTKSGCFCRMTYKVLLFYGICLFKSLFDDGYVLPVGRSVFVFLRLSRLHAAIAQNNGEWYYIYIVIDIVITINTIKYCDTVLGPQRPSLLLTHAIHEERLLKSE